MIHIGTYYTYNVTYIGTTCDKCNTTIFISKKGINLSATIKCAACGYFPLRTSSLETPEHRIFWHFSNI